MSAVWRRVFATAAVAAGLAAPPAATGLPVGYDISFPQCGGAFPSAPAFAIIGVTGGKPFEPHPCLGAGSHPSQLAWGGPSAGLYINVANPGPALSPFWPRGQTTPRECATPTRPGDDTADCAYDYGWNSAADAYDKAVLAYQSLGLVPAGAVGTPAAVPWWLDVETGNSWRPEAVLNVAAIKGAADYLRAAGAANVGVYSSFGDWQKIVGETNEFAELPSWLAGPNTQTEAEAACGGLGFTLGGVSLVQFPSQGFDGNVRCPPVLARAGAPLSVVAGAVSRPIAVRVTPAQDAPLTLTVSGVGVAAAPGGPLAGSQSVVVPSGRRSAPAVYFTSRRAGRSTITVAAADATPLRIDVFVTPARPATLRLLPRGPARVKVGRSIRITAAGKDRFGNNVRATPRWTIKPALGRLRVKGSSVRITATRAGRAVVTARVGRVARSIRVVVSP